MQIKGPIKFGKDCEFPKELLSQAKITLPFSSETLIVVEKLPEGNFIDSDGTPIDMVKK